MCKCASLLCLPEVRELSTDEKALESIAGTEGASSDLPSIKTESNTGQQQVPQAQQGSDVDGSATTVDQQVNTEDQFLLF